MVSGVRCQLKDPGFRIPDTGRLSRAAADSAGHAALMHLENLSGRSMPKDIKKCKLSLIILLKLILVSPPGIFGVFTTGGASYFLLKHNDKHSSLNYRLNSFARGQAMGWNL